MKRSLLAGIAVLSISAGTQALAQTAIVEITPQQRTIIREHVVTQRVAPITIPGQLRVGAALPADVNLVTVPDGWGPEFRRYRYVYWNDRVVLVEPGSRKVVQIID
jgi:Protein of unknown function (DUF1236)